MTKFRDGQGRESKFVISWTVGGKRKRGRPKQTWRKTFKEDVERVEIPLEDIFVACGQLLLDSGGSTGGQGGHGPLETFLAPSLAPTLL